MVEVVDFIAGNLVAIFALLISIATFYLTHLKGPDIKLVVDSEADCHIAQKHPRKDDPLEGLVIKVDHLFVNQGTAAGTVLEMDCDLLRPLALLQDPMIYETKRRGMWGWSGVMLQSRSRGEEDGYKAGAEIEVGQRPLVLGEKEHLPVNVVIPLHSLAVDHEAEKGICKLPELVRRTSQPDGIEVRVRYRTTRVTGFVRRRISAKENEVAVTISGDKLAEAMERYVD